MHAHRPLHARRATFCVPFLFVFAIPHSGAVFSCDTRPHDCDEQCMAMHASCHTPTTLKSKRNLPWIQVWRCPQLQDSHSQRLPVVTYLLGQNGPRMGSGMFEFVPEASMGTLYLVLSTPMNVQLFAAKQILYGEIGLRTCERAGARIMLPKLWLPAHYSAEFDLWKLMVHRHVPENESAAVLLDADTYLLPRSMEMLQLQLESLNVSQFIAASLNEANTKDGINSGVLVLRFDRMRAWESSFCPDHWWFACVHRFFDNSRRIGDNADQGMWNSLLVDHSELWKPLPCGYHAHVDVLRYYAATHVLNSSATVHRCSKARELRAILMKHSKLEAVSRKSIVAIRKRKGAVQHMLGINRDTHPCGLAQFKPNGSVFAARARAEGTLKPHWPLVAHGAAWIQPIARLFVRLESTPPNERERILEDFPCWCYGAVHADDESRMDSFRSMPPGLLKKQHGRMHCQHLGQTNATNRS